ncbi:BLUF domain-containing protein [Aequorivita viscosa]|nr:BLUF domain-containing protein [Aequorivita viscosa]
MLYTVCYISNAISLWENGQLQDFFESVVKRNNALDISGLLLYHEGTFVQVLEGDQITVDSLFSAVKSDTRHNQLTVMMEREIKHRIFKNYRTSSISSGNDPELRKLKSRVQLPKVSKYAKSLWAILQPFYLIEQTTLYGYEIK